MGVNKSNNTRPGDDIKLAKEELNAIVKFATRLTISKWHTYYIINFLITAVAILTFYVAPVGVAIYTTASVIITLLVLIKLHVNVYRTYVVYFEYLRSIDNKNTNSQADYFKKIMCNHVGAKKADVDGYFDELLVSRRIGIVN